MSFLPEPKAYTPDEFGDFVEKLEWNGWRPTFVTLHNTGVPSLAVWLDPRHAAKQRIESQGHYERDILHWHSGVHLFVAPNLIWNLCDLTSQGVSVSCWNHLTIGIEMIGDYATESFDSGPGAQVRDNAVAAMAILHRKLGLRPDRYRLGVRGLHFHKECRRDHHDCPGRNVVKADVVARVLAKMNALGASLPGADH
ncbi:MAG TPA: N-acetylmuramoyl-L-alanine amidase [Methylovirgula sp.]|nr:N-acetylmuramoyl-L-alanine amidase [Methylovirgula sp.]